MMKSLLRTRFGRCTRTCSRSNSLVAAAIQDTSLTVKTEITEAIARIALRFGFAGRSAAAQDRADPCEQLARIEGFGQVVIGADLGR
jgi:hypothetical protein